MIDTGEQNNSETLSIRAFVLLVDDTNGIISLYVLATSMNESLRAVAETDNQSSEQTKNFVLFNDNACKFIQRYVNMDVTRDSMN